MKRRIHLRISGRVQGVSYRAYASKKATELGLGGWVRNVPDGTVELVAEGDPEPELGLGGWVRNVTDGTVELVAEGDPEPLASLLDWCWQGSPWAQVQAIDAQWSDATGEHATFGVGATK